jgi:hypothetical protein
MRCMSCCCQSKLVKCMAMVEFGGVYMVESIHMHADEDSSVEFVTLSPAAETDSRIAGVKVLLHSTTPEWATWRERHMECLPELAAHTVQLETKRRGAGASERWIQGNYLRYLQACHPPSATTFFLNEEKLQRQLIFFFYTRKQKAASSASLLKKVLAEEGAQAYSF